MWPRTRAGPRQWPCSCASAPAPLIPYRHLRERDALKCMLVSSGWNSHLRQMLGGQISVTTNQCKATCPPLLCMPTHAHDMQTTGPITAAGMVRTAQVRLTTQILDQDCTGAWVWGTPKTSWHTVAQGHIPGRCNESTPFVLWLYQTEILSLLPGKESEIQMR
jgi:hypothetical protein